MKPQEAAASNARDEIVRRIVRIAAPERIVVFGSASCGEVVDVVVVTPADVDRYRDALGLVIALALREGRVIHAA